MRLDDVFAAAVATVRARVVNYVGGLFGPAAVTDTGMDDFVARALPVVAAGQRKTAALTDAYLTRVLADDFGERLRAPRMIDTRALRGVDPAIVYSRPTKTVRYELSQGKTIDAAVAEGAKRLTKIAQSDMQLAKTHQARATLSGSTVDGFERVLNGDYSCLKCVVASTRFYHKENLSPMHPGCDCGVKPVRKPKGKRIVLHPERLEAVHDKAAEYGIENAAGQGYQDLLITHEHGELGPVLGWRDEQFRGQSEVPAAARAPKRRRPQPGPRPVPQPVPQPVPRQPAAAELRTDAATARRLLPGLEASLANLRARGLPEDSPQIQYHLTQIARLRGYLEAAAAA